MSTSSESGPDKAELDLDLQLLPAWAQRPPEENKYAKYEGGAEDRSSRRTPRSHQGELRRPGPGFRRERPDRDAGRGEQRSAQPQGKPHRAEKTDRPAPRIEINVAFLPDERGVESLARQIHLTGRAYPLFGIATLILKKPDRYRVQFSVVKTPEGRIAQTLFACGLDDTLWLSEQDAVDHVLIKHFATFYRAERVATDPPKGTYTFVAQCALSGTILGPPNYHDYQTKLRQLHSVRFSHMPFEVFKSRIKIVRDEAIVKKWVEEQSWKTEYICLNVPEASKLASPEEVEKHFREFHLSNVIKPVESHALTGSAAHALPDRAFQSLVRRSLDDQMRFPLRVVNVLSQQFAGHGLQFFKVNKTVTHVAVARPHYLDVEATPVSESIKRIVTLINSTPSCTRRKLLESLAPGTSIPTSSTKEETPQKETTAPSPEAAAIVSDLHWLIHQGHVIEFSNGVLETAKKPTLKPPKVGPKSASPSEARESQPARDQSENEHLGRSESAPLVEPSREMAADAETTAATGLPRVSTDGTEETISSPSDRVVSREPAGSPESVAPSKPVADPPA